MIKWIEYVIRVLLQFGHSHLMNAELMQYNVVQSQYIVKLLLTLLYRVKSGFYSVHMFELKNSSYKFYQVPTS